jgi:hypothetical protein
MEEKFLGNSFGLTCLRKVKNNKSITEKYEGKFLVSFLDSFIATDYILLPLKKSTHSKYKS